MEHLLWDWLLLATSTLSSMNLLPCTAAELSLDHIADGQALRELTEPLLKYLLMPRLALEPSGLV